MMRFGLNVEDKKTLVKRIGELTGLQPRYTFMPRRATPLCPDARMRSECTR